MAALLRDALQPNLVQTLEGSPALVHGGPFANIAHGCNSVIATRLGLKLADVVVTEAGFGADLGRREVPRHQVPHRRARAGLRGGGGDRPRAEDAWRRGQVPTSARRTWRRCGAVWPTWRATSRTCGKFGLPVVVALNRFTGRHRRRDRRRPGAVAPLGVEVVPVHPLGGGRGGRGRAGPRGAGADRRRRRATYRPLYPDAMPLADKLRTVAREIYRAADVADPARGRRAAGGSRTAGFGDVPVCIAKTQYSFSADPAALGAPEGHVLPVREVRLSAGAGFVVAVCGDIMTMPGLPRHPAAEAIGWTPTGRIDGLF